MNFDQELVSDAAALPQGITEEMHFQWLATWPPPSPPRGKLKRRKCAPVFLSAINADLMTGLSYHDQGKAI